MRYEDKKRLEELRGYGTLTQDQAMELFQLMKMEEADAVVVEETVDDIPVPAPVKRGRKRVTH